MIKQLLKKLFTVIIAILMLSALPKPASGQRKCNPHAKCPTGYTCDASGYCVLIPCNCNTRPLPARCGPICGFLVQDTSELPSFSFQLSEAANVSIKIYDVTGRLIKTLVNENMPLGDHQIEWDISDQDGKAVNSGIYILQFDTGNKSESKKITVIK